MNTVQMFTVYVSIGMTGCGKTQYCDEFAALVCACEGEAWDCVGARQTATQAQGDDVAQKACKARLKSFEADGGCAELGDTGHEEDTADPI